MNPKKHGDPAIVDVGFTPNCWGDWWFTKPDNRFTIQILPTSTLHDSRGWRIGIACPGGIKWGPMKFPIPEAAAIYATRFVNDNDLLNHITTAMQTNYDNQQQRIKRAITILIRRNL